MARQVLLKLKAEQLKLPARLPGGPGKGQRVWKEASYRAVVRILPNPASAGGYVSGECAYDGAQRDPKTGKARPRLRPPEQWPGCLRDHHAGYIGWEDYLANRQRLH